MACSAHRSKDAKPLASSFTDAQHDTINGRSLKRTNQRRCQRSGSLKCRQFFLFLLLSSFQPPPKALRCQRLSGVCLHLKAREKRKNSGQLQKPNKHKRSLIAGKRHTQAHSNRDQHSNTPFKLVERRMLKNTTANNKIQNIDHKGRDLGSTSDE